MIPQSAELQRHLAAMQARLHAKKVKSRRQALYGQLFGLTQTIQPAQNLGELVTTHCGRVVEKDPDGYRTVAHVAAVLCRREDGAYGRLFAARFGWEWDRLEVFAEATSEAIEWDALTAFHRWVERDTATRNGGFLSVFALGEYRLADDE
ncbi:hypothetical protein A3H16_04080 [Candidatus Kaiserbacteria bacterium RIFCSPLOWO2_12_FULL_53_8]|uniref:Uncharacterized protein n=2 Tax=Candidatus Kaiseribacteriota TaxID=1752734 RepID=A0A1F6CTR7_9BACT|nr:MAG: hypothetical protein A2851_05540 [Candidatus Kaiserbacteria bacterium RIFCSPHIGHO2_01_FULL_53_29]OGG92397.1 MAG: hypothetical protein A3H16_04080 [Candidatus Kaiserbacteria bacterium RIFCSPLOWO2_12_FULL_53_8]